MLVSKAYAVVGAFSVPYTHVQTLFVAIIVPLAPIPTGSALFGCEWAMTAPKPRLVKPLPITHPHQAKLDPLDSSDPANKFRFSNDSIMI